MRSCLEALGSTRSQKSQSEPFGTLILPTEPSILGILLQGLCIFRLQCTGREPDSEKDCAWTARRVEQLHNLYWSWNLAQHGRLSAGSGILSRSPSFDFKRVFRPLDTLMRPTSVLGSTTSLACCECCEVLPDDRHRMWLQGRRYRWFKMSWGKASARNQPQYFTIFISIYLSIYIYIYILQLNPQQLDDWRWTSNGCQWDRLKPL